MRWWRRAVELAELASDPVDTVSVSDPAAAEYFRIGNPNYSGVAISEGIALGLSAFYRAICLVSGTIAMLPMRTIRDVAGVVTQFRSVFDDPGDVIDMTPFEWKQTVVAQQLMHGDAFLAHVFNNAGTLAGLVPVHPLNVTIDPPPRRGSGDPAAPFNKTYTARLADGSQRTFDRSTMTHCPALSVDGAGRGLSLIGVARNSLGIAVAGDRAAARMFSDGALISGLAVPDEGETVDPADVITIKDELDRTLGGWENAATVAVVNRRLKFMPWTMSNADAQFLQSRQFQVEEVARWTGVPPHLLMQTEKQTSWGTGVAEQNRGLSRYTLAHWTTRLQQRMTRLLPKPREVLFDYHEWEKPTPETEVDLLVKQTGRPFMTVNEARAQRGLGPLEGGDELAAPTPSAGAHVHEPPATAVPADDLREEVLA